MLDWAWTLWLVLRHFTLHCQHGAHTAPVKEKVFEGLGDVHGPHMAHLECEAKAGAPPPSLSASLGARAPGAPAGSILTSARLLKRETYRGRPQDTKGFTKPPLTI